MNMAAVTVHQTRLLPDLKILKRDEGIVGLHFPLANPLKPMVTLIHLLTSEVVSLAAVLESSTPWEGSINNPKEDRGVSWEISAERQDCSPGPQTQSTGRQVPGGWLDWRPKGAVVAPSPRMKLEGSGTPLLCSVCARSPIRGQQRGIPGTTGSRPNWL